MNTEPEARLVNLTEDSDTVLGDQAIIGRKDGCSVVLADIRVSRRHAMIRRHEDGEYWFYDLGSFNGSYLNGERVTTARELENGDVIRICDFELRFDLNAPGESLPGVPDEGESVVVPMIILVSDIKGFTRLSELMPPEEVAQAIGSWYGYCDQVLTEHGAAIDKFIGDAVLAYWTDTSVNARRWALSAARYLRESCDLIQEEMRWTFEKHGLSFESGVALHLGEVAWSQFAKGGLTMLGDSVNITFRIQALTRSLGQDILVSSEFLRGWKEGKELCTHMGLHELKGRANPVDLYTASRTPDLFVK